MNPAADINSFEIPDHFKRRLIEATRGSGFGRQFFRGLNAYSGDHGVWHRVKTYAAGVFGSLFFGATSYFSIDGSVRMIDVSLEEDPVLSDIGHGGEWLQQPFQYGLAIHMYLISALSNRGCYEEVKEVYREIIASIAESDGCDIEAFYDKLEADVSYLAGRSLSRTNPLEIRAFLIDLFSEIDLTIHDCPPLRLDRQLETHYRDLAAELKAGDAWTVSQTAQDIRDGFRLLGNRGIVQALEKGVGVAVFDIAMLVSIGFMFWGLTIVFDEVLLSRDAPESSGHLSEWSINILTNVFLIYLVHSWTIKREVTLNKTRRIMCDHFKSDDLEAGGHGLTGPQAERLLDACNRYLDSLAAKCQFNTLPSQYRIHHL